MPPARPPAPKPMLDSIAKHRASPAATLVSGRNASGPRGSPHSGSASADPSPPCPCRLQAPSGGCAPPPLFRPATTHTGGKQPSGGPAGQQRSPLQPRHHAGAPAGRELPLGQHQASQCRASSRPPPAHTAQIDLAGWRTPLASTASWPRAAPGLPSLACHPNDEHHQVGAGGWLSLVERSRGTAARGGIPQRRGDQSHIRNRLRVL